MSSLQNQVAIITGATRGIGKGITLKFAAEGANIALIGTNQQIGDSIVKELADTYPHAQFKFYALNVASTQQVEEICKQIVVDFQTIDILVNNAGITIDRLLLKMTEEDWDQVLDVNLKSCYNTCHAVARLMLKAKKGRIINISSVVGLTGNAGQTNYAAAKAGMIGFTKSLAKELASRHILVNCIAPGFIQTDMTKQLSEIQQKEIQEQIPLKQWGSVTDIANMAWFLASSLSPYITGQVFVVDGGLTG